ncbi:MAG: limonene-1,2-epoxide hydrolase family protein [Pseudomonadales bacterium]
MSAESDLILRMIDGFNKIDLDAIVACFADDAIYDNVPMAAVQGTDAIRATLQGFMGAASEVQWDIVNIVADDGVVLTERVDKFKINDQWIELRVMGAFEVADGKITAWRDYFDMNQFQTQFAAASG